MPMPHQAAVAYGSTRSVGSRFSLIRADQLFTGGVRHTKLFHQFGDKHLIFRDDVSTCGGAFLAAVSERRLELTLPELESVRRDAQQNGTGSHGFVRSRFGMIQQVLHGL